MTLLLLLLGCAHRPAPPPPEPPPRDACEAFERALDGRRSVSALGEELPATGPVPADLEDAVALAERMGWLLYAEDTAARRAREVLAPALRSDPRLEPGWVTVPGEGGLIVHFVGEVDGQHRSLYRVTFDPVAEKLVSIDPPAEALAKGPPEPQALAPEVEAMVRALRTASLATFDLSPTGVRTAVLPVNTARGPSWMVYFLAGEMMDDYVVVAGHVAVWTDFEGQEVLDVHEHGEELRQRPLPDPEGPLMRMEHSLTDWPIETHVFTSLRHDIPLCVKTERGWWAVVGERVLWLGSD
ncbi:MAG: hypothetical protein H6740_17730 [Alphaproteobacteria bacterium]|nr:hypothetical protein [Alphaproteobacteria bacterium]